MNNETIDIANMYEERSFTDMRCGGITQFIPVLEDGSQDVSRAPIFVAVANVSTPNGPFSIQAPIAGATTLKDAAKGFNSAIETRLGDIMRQAQELEKEERSRIITPEELIGKGGGLSLVK